jgi:hypothetical protein
MVQPNSQARFSEHYMWNVEGPDLTGEKGPNQHRTVEAGEKRVYKALLKA